LTLLLRVRPERSTEKKGTNRTNEIAQLLQQKFGLSPDQAQEAEGAILDLIRSKVPPQFQGIVNTLLSSGQPAGSDRRKPPSPAWAV
jgi:hypothetical protein